MKDDDLKSQVAAEFSWDPQVDSDAIEISAASGTVTLRGIVASLRLKRAGGEAAARVRGVTRVANELQVQIPDTDLRDDEDLRGDVLEALMLDSSVPMTVDAQARDAILFDRALPAEEFLDRQAVEPARLLQRDRAAAHGLNDDRFAPHNPTRGVGRGQFMAWRRHLGAIAARGEGIGSDHLRHLEVVFHECQSIGQHLKNP